MKLAKESAPLRIVSRNGSNGVRKVETTYTDKRRDEYYQVGQQDFRALVGGKAAGSYNASPHFPALEWLPSGSRYIGLESIDEIPCHRFEVKPEYLVSNYVPEGTKWVAWISASTGYPVQVQYGDELYQFSEVTTFTESVTLPPLFQAALEKQQKQLRALKALQLANQR